MFFPDTSDDFYPEDYFDYMFENMYEDVYDDSDFLQSAEDEYDDEYSYRSCPPDDELKQMNRCLGICAKLNESRKEGMFCNATIVIQGRKFSVHKNILMASSSYFSAMFVGSFAEKNEEEIEVLGVSPEVFAVVLDYMYGAAIKLTFENVKDLYIAGDMLCIDTLIADCKSYIKSNWRTANDVQAVYEMAGQFEMNDIIEDIVTQVRTNFSTCWGCMLNFRELSHSFLLTMLDGRNSLNQLKNESTVVNNILHWATHKPHERIPDLVLKVFPVVHFELIAETTFTEILSFKCIPEGAVSTGDLIKLKTSLEELYRHSHQKAIDHGFRLVLLDFFDNISVNTFDCETWKWEKVPCSLFRRPQSCILSDNDLYIFTNEGGTKLDLSSGLNITLPNFPERRVKSVFSVLNRTVYVTGGTKEGTNMPLGDILSLSPSSKYWKTGISWRKAKSEASSFAHEQNIYLVGGISGGHERPTYSDRTECFVYNTLTRYFRRLCTLPVSIRKPNLTIHEGVLYIFSNQSVHIKPCVEAVDLKRQKVITSDIKMLDLAYPILSVCSVASGILIAYSFDGKVLLTLYRPMGDRASELLAVVSNPIASSDDRQLSNYKLLFYIPK